MFEKKIHMIVIRKKLKLMISEAIVRCILRIHHLFYTNSQSEMFTYICENLKPNFDYSSHCFKIVNRHYIDYVVGKFNS